MKHLPDSLVTYISEGLDTAWTTGKAAVFHDLVRERNGFFFVGNSFGLVWFIRSHCQEITLCTQNAGYEKLDQSSFSQSPAMR